jgi:ceramide synthetase
MLLHHMMTLILISNQYLIDQNTIGSVVLFLHDVSDFFLFLARICNDFKVNAIWYSKLVMAFFLGSWLLTRLVYFPVSIILPTTRYSFGNLFSQEETVRLGCRCLSF